MPVMRASTQNIQRFTLIRRRPPSATTPGKPGIRRIAVVRRRELWPASPRTAGP